jgi:hypothetical protein
MPQNDVGPRSGTRRPGGVSNQLTPICIDTTATVIAQCVTLLTPLAAYSPTNATRPDWQQWESQGLAPTGLAPRGTGSKGDGLQAGAAPKGHATRVDACLEM